MSKPKKYQLIFRWIGWVATAASTIWGGLFYLRFNNPIVDAFHDISAQVAALQAEAVSWQIAGFLLISSAIISLGIGYLGRGATEALQGEDAPETTKKNMVEGT